MFSLKHNKNIKGHTIHVQTRSRKCGVVVMEPAVKKLEKAPAVLWMHGGGHFFGMKEMVYISRAVDLTEKFGVICFSPGYKMSFQSPFPSDINDCYDVLLYIKEHADELGIDKNQIMIGGESAGGGLCAGLSMMARDLGEVNIAYQMPLYPMIDNFDTESSRDNHGRVWNTKRNHLAWKLYLRDKAHEKVSPYAAPAGQTDFKGLPPTYTFVADGEPFLDETVTFVNNLKKAGVEASVDVYHTDMHAFDMLEPKWEVSKQAIANFDKKFEYAVNNYFAKN